MHQPVAFIAYPSLALEQRHVTYLQAVDLFHLELRAHGAAVLLGLGGGQPLAAITAVGREQPQRHVVDMKAWTHRAFQYANPHADPAGIEQAGEGRH